MEYGTSLYVDNEQIAKAVVLHSRIREMLGLGLGRNTAQSQISTKLFFLQEDYL
jgi:hypothetical protein